MKTLLFSSAFILSALTARADLATTFVKKVSVPNPAFVSFVDLGAAQDALTITSFGVLSSGAVYSFENPENILRSSVQATRLADGFLWPNEIVRAPAGVFPQEALVVADGFLTPGKSDGSVVVLEVNGKNAYSVTPKKKGWFYHRVVFKDMNGDGRLDILTARAKKSIFSSGRGELLWLEQPAKVEWGQKWKAHVLADGPDVNFALADLDDDGQEEIVATEFFGKKLSVLWQDGPQWSRKVVDSTVGSAFDLSLTDVNQDGRLDALVTNHEKDSKASVFAYEIPVDFKNSDWTRHTLLTGIKTRKGGFAPQASPGSAHTFHPEVSREGTDKPWILVNGDGSQRLHLLVPKSESSTDWAYEEQVVFETSNSVIGQTAVKDVDGDGFVELFSPAYGESNVYIYTFGPGGKAAN